MAIRKPAEVSPPGEFLREELEARGWSQADFADILGRPAAVVSDVLSGKRSISPDTARRIGAALGTSAELWMNLDAAYRLSRLGSDDSCAVSRRAKLYAKAPIKDLVRRGWIEPSDSVEVLENRLCAFLNIEDIDDEPELPLHAARKSTSYMAPPTAVQQAWLIRAMQLARAVHAQPFSEKGLVEALARLRLLTHVPQEIRHVPRVLSDAGVRFIIVQPLPGSRIDGACLWVDGVPTIALSLRFDRIDNFWFVLLHELDHVRNRQESLDVDLDFQKGGYDTSEIERTANEFAVEFLVPQAQLDSFVARVRPLYSARRIEAFARTTNVHPAIVVGQLQHRGEIACSSFRKLMVPVREWITASTLTDGWGNELPARL